MDLSKRGSGILMHISSLPTPYGIGTMGKDAYDFVDFLSETGHSYWQLLPLGYTGFGDSPYQTYSMFAGNPNLIDLDTLIGEGLLEKKDLEGMKWGENRQEVDFDVVSENREKLFKRAYLKALDSATYRDDLHKYRGLNHTWLEDFSLFMAAKGHFDGKSWQEWEDVGLVMHESDSIVRWREELEDEMSYVCFVQFLFSRQWERLKEYANERGIMIIGDIPIYPSLDSADVWARPECFKLDEQRVPTQVAGVPPDYFSEDGQLWGNPLYNWEKLANDGYSLWMDRLKSSAELFDVIRIDHFRGIASYWEVPWGKDTAKEGRWQPGPGMDFIRAVKNNFPNLEIIAEDLGMLTPDVEKLLIESGLPGMKVLQFAFDPSSPSSYLPFMHGENSVCYTGTHDNNTAMGWLEEMTDEQLEYARAYMNAELSENVGWELAHAGMTSSAKIFIAQMQDYLGLDSDCRMNTPGTIGGNWKWRMLPNCYSDALVRKLTKLNRISWRYKEPKIAKNTTTEITSC